MFKSEDDSVPSGRVRVGYIVLCHVTSPLLYCLSVWREGGEFPLHYTTVDCCRVSYIIYHHAELGLDREVQGSVGRPLGLAENRVGGDPPVRSGSGPNPSPVTFLWGTNATRNDPECCVSSPLYQSAFCLMRNCAAFTTHTRAAQMSTKYRQIITQIPTMDARTAWSAGLADV
jgi:hypothetical protein